MRKQSELSATWRMQFLMAFGWMFVFVCVAAASFDTDLGTV